MAAVEELNYSKNAIASGLRGKKRGMIYIIIPQFSNIYYTRVCEAIENVLFENGLVPVICDTREDPEREKRLLELAISQRLRRDSAWAYDQRLGEYGGGQKPEYPACRGRARAWFAQ